MNEDDIVERVANTLEHGFRIGQRVQRSDDEGVGEIIEFTPTGAVVLFTRMNVHGQITNAYHHHIMYGYFRAASC
jgi:hypothetical protein